MKEFLRKRKWTIILLLVLTSVTTGEVYFALKSFEVYKILFADIYYRLVTLFAIGSVHFIFYFVLLVAYHLELQADAVEK